jgi:hypothetical protein
MNMDFLSEKLLFSVDSARRENQVWSRGPMPGQKIISRVSRDQKRRRFLFSKCGLPPFQRGDPFATASLCGNKKGGTFEGFSRPFLSSAPAFLPGQQGNGFKRSTKLEMVLDFRHLRHFGF